MQQLLRLGALADPRRKWLAFVFVSGKALRALVPFLAMVAVLANAVLALQGEWLFQVMLVGEALVFAIASAVIMTRRAWHPKPLKWLGYLVEGYLASAIGALSILTGRSRKPWRPSAESERLNVSDTYIPRSVRIGKRIVDVVAAILGLSFLAIVFIPIAVAIKVSSPGPIFYCQQRVGRSTARVTYLFEVVKFRSMRQDAEAISGPRWADKMDSRVTPVGRFLRKTRLDELPQFINVLQGDMSLIGPRPERPVFFKTLEQEIPFYAERTFGLKPGITGLAQVQQEPDTSIDDVRRKVMMDHTYAIGLTSFWGWLKMDLWVVLQTFKVVLTARGH